MTTLYTTLRAANLARQAEWDPDDQIDLTYRLNELAGETGEACNVGKKIQRERLGIRGSRATLQDLADELADVIICADLVAAAEGIDLMAAVVRKFNATSEKVGLNTRLADASEAGEDACPICLGLFKPDDLCLSDITEGTCHAACLEGSPVVDLGTGEPLPEASPAPKPYRYGDL